MTVKPKLLDLFCCAGGAGAGYADAGFEVWGVDIAPQPNYPFKFAQLDALTLPPEFLQQFDAVHASPPCQSYSPLNAYNHHIYADLVGVTRSLLQKAGRPFIIENVVQAPLIEPIILCGAMFDLRVYRHRAFETNFALHPPAHPLHRQKCSRNGVLPGVGQFMTISGGKHAEAWRVRAAAEMGVPWTKTIREVCESIPPSYTRWIGSHLMMAVV